MAAKAVGVRLFCGIMFLVQKYCCIRCRVPSGGPFGILHTMAAFAVIHRLKHLRFGQRYLFPLLLGEMVDEHHPIFPQAVQAVAEGRAVTFLAVKGAMPALRPHVG